MRKNLTELFDSLWGPLSGCHMRQMGRALSSGLFLCLVGVHSHAQGQLWGMTSRGGLGDIGVIFNCNGDATNFSIKYDFSAFADGAIASSVAILGKYPSEIMQHTNGKFYGVTVGGGMYSNGVLYEYDPVSHVGTIRHFFNDEFGKNPIVRLLEATNGKLYGTTSQGGLNNEGILFEYDPNDNVFTKRLDFGGDKGAVPDGCSLIEGNDGKVYGLTISGGQYNKGTLYEYDLSKNTYAIKFSFQDATSGYEPKGALVIDRSGNLFGTTQKGGEYNNGVIFEFDPHEQVFTRKYSFAQSDAVYPSGNLVMASDGSLYGLSSNGGQDGRGTIFEFNPSASQFKKLSDFDLSVGASPGSGLVEGLPGKLYGLTFIGGANDKGVLFEFDIETKALLRQTDFNGTTNGAFPYGRLFKSTDGNLYGVTPRGGGNDFGALFKFDPNLKSLTTIIDFGPSSSSGVEPGGTLMQAANGKLYGTTRTGGVFTNSIGASYGVLFEYDFKNGSYQKKIDFNGGSIGSNPAWTLTEIGGKFYGLTESGGANNVGILFEYDYVNNQIQNKKDLIANPNAQNYTRGKFAQASNQKLYGVTHRGGANDMGLLFEFDPTSNTFTTKVNFAGASNGAYPKGGMITASNGKLYGMTWMGGTKGQGILYEYDPVAETITKKFDFDISVGGAYPLGSLMQASNGKMYGMTYRGGNADLGTLFEFDPATGGVSVKVHFSDSQGSHPFGEVVESGNQKLYGMTYSGGASNKGVLFEYDPQNNSYIKRLDFDFNTGYQPMGSLMYSSEPYQNPALKISSLAKVVVNVAIVKSAEVLTVLQDENLSEHKGIMVFPNPTNSTLYLDLSELDPLHAEVVIYDALGNKVISSEQQGGQVIKLNVSNIRNGFYLLHVYQQRRKYYRKFLKY